MMGFDEQHFCARKNVGIMVQVEALKNIVTR